MPAPVVSRGLKYTSPGGGLDVGVTKVSKPALERLGEETCALLLGRCRAAYAAGGRSQGDELVSTYFGGDAVVVTWPDDQVLFLSEETGPEAAAEIRRMHRREGDERTGG